jgi:hypothetical protein
MADLSFTAASVVMTGGTRDTYIAGGTIARGNLVRLNTSNQAVASSDDSAANAAAFGYALNDAASGQPVEVGLLNGGGILAGATFAVGKVYVQSTSGATAPVDDIAGTEFITVVGVGVTASTMQMGRIVSGVAAAGAVS